MRGSNVCLNVFEVQVERTPNNVAAAMETETLTYAELNARANQLAHYLRAQGVGPEVLVALCVERSLDMMIGLLGILKAGGAYLPLDPSYPRERLAFMLEDARPHVLLTHANTRTLLPDTQLTINNQQSTIINLSTDWPTIALESSTNPDTAVTLANLAYVIYTSGSTGRPKGTMLTHRGLTNYLNWCQHAYPLDEGSGALVHSTIAFDATITGLFAPLLAGRTVSLLPEAIDIDDLGLALHGGDYSLLKITPAHLELLSHQLPPDAARKLTKSFVIGGENLTAEQIAFWQENAPDTLLFNEYGPTENVVGCIVYEAVTWHGSGSVPIGRAIPNTQAYVLDKQLEPVPIGVPGELYLGGVAVARGYLNRPDTTAEKFIPDPFSDAPGARLYRTGDLVRWLEGEGEMEFLGRMDDQVKIRGFRIELGEIEAVLAQHPDVQQTVVVVREQPPGNKQLAAYIAVNPDAMLTPDELRTFLHRSLPAYMVPATFTLLVRLPLSPNGKVDRRALPEPEREQPFVAPRTPLETELADVWAAVLRIERVGVHDNFFELGGHSLLATQLIARLRTMLQMELPVRRIFEAPHRCGAGPTHRNHSVGHGGGI